MTSHMVDKVCNTCQKGKKSKGAINCDWCGTRFASTNEEGCKKCILQLNRFVAWTIKRGLGSWWCLGKWSACSPSTPTIRVQIWLTTLIFFSETVSENQENLQLERRGWPSF